MKCARSFAMISIMISCLVFIDDAWSWDEAREFREFGEFGGHQT